MEIDELIKYVKPEKIDLGDYVFFEPRPAYQGHILFVNRLASTEEQVKAVLHELIYMSAEFEVYSYRMLEGKPKNQEKESEIGRLAKELYETRPDVVEKIEDSLQKAAELFKKD